MGKTNYNKISESNNDGANTTPVTPEVPKTAKGVVSNCAALRVRKDPSVKSNNIISVIDANTEVEINLDESKESWYKITTKGGVTGFCMKDYITVK